MNNARQELDRVTALLESIEAAKASQPQRLANMRADACNAREQALRDEPWDTLWAALPGVDANTGELTGMLALPSIDAKELFGARLAFDLAGGCGDAEDADDILNACLSEVGSPEHVFLVFASALRVLAEDVIPILLRGLEERGGDWDARVRLADAARNAWTSRVLSTEDGAA